MDFKATLIKASGQVKDVTPKDGKAFPLAKLYEMLDCNMVEFLSFPDGRLMICDEEGRLNGSEMNPKAMEVWAEAWPKKKYPLNNDGIVVGNVLICENYPQDSE